MKRYCVRRNSSTGRWLIYWFSDYTSAYHIIGSSNTMFNAIEAIYE